MPQADRRDGNLEETSSGMFQKEVSKIKGDSGDLSNDIYKDFDELLPPIEDCEEQFRYVYEWEIESWSNLLPPNSNSVYSDTFEAGGYRWRILLFPNGNTTEKDVACFLDNQDSHEPSLDPNWHVCANFSLVFRNIYGLASLTNFTARHRFTPTENDWGFNNIIPISDLRAPSTRGGSPDSALLIDDKIIIRAYIRGYKDENGVLWHKFENWDSRKETGYVGLRNQGATCYMNSLLQSLYFTPIFCRSTFKIPTENDEPCESVALALQRLFYNLATSSDTVSTHELTKSFGWDANDSYLQHDVQEFNRVLQDNLENKMKGTVAEKAISRLFQGKMKSVIRCLQVKCESSRTEDFYDIQLDVKGCKNINDSFMEYIKKEILEGDNKYYSSEHGLQDATKGVIFEYFPPILHLQLKRFEYDFNSASMIKINDYYEFPLAFSVRDYLEDPTKFEDNDLIYHLHGVLVHSGDLHCGHYCAFIRPGVEDKWFKFDDERVAPSSEKEALNQNFGESPQTTPNYPADANFNRFKRDFLYTKNHKRFTNAYMLVYLKDSERAEILRPLNIEDDVPGHLINSMNRENILLENDKKDNIENGRLIEARLLTDDIMASHYGYGLVSSRTEQQNATKFSFKFRREDSVKHLKDCVSLKLGLDSDRFRLWVTSPRQVASCRPDALLTEKQDRDMLYHIIEFSKAFQRQKTLTLYLEKLPTDENVENGGLINDYGKKMSDIQRECGIILYLKYYDSSTNQVKYVGSAVVDRKSKVSDVTSILINRLSLPHDANLAVYEEPKPSTAEVHQIDQNSYLQKVGIVSGVILCFEDLTNLEYMEGFGVHRFYENILDSISLTLIPKKTSKMKNPKSIICVLANKNDKEKDLIAKVLNHPEFPESNPSSVRFWMALQPFSSLCDTYWRFLSLPQRFCGNITLGQFLELPFRQGPYHQSSMMPTVLEYEIIDQSTVDLSKKCLFTVSYVDKYLKRTGTYDAVVPLDDKVQSLIHEVLNRVTVEDGGTGLFRILELNRFGNIRVLHPSAPISSVSEISQLYVEELPLDERMSVSMASSRCVPKNGPQAGSRQTDHAMHERKVMRALPPDSNEHLSEVDCRNHDSVGLDASKGFAISCISFSRDPSKPNGIPFRFIVFPGEVFSETKKRLMARMGLPDKLSNKVQYTITSFSSPSPRTPLDNDILSEFEWTDDKILECDHTGKVGRMGRYNSEKPVKING